MVSILLLKGHSGKFEGTLLIKGKSRKLEGQWHTLEGPRQRVMSTLESLDALALCAIACGRPDLRFGSEAQAFRVWRTSDGYRENIKVMCNLDHVCRTVGPTVHSQP